MADGGGASAASGAPTADMKRLSVKEKQAVSGDSAANAQQQQRKRKPTDFEFGEVLGEGSYATVMLAKEKETGRDFAVKMLDKKHIIKEKKIEYVNTEKQCFNMINHPFFVRLYYTFQDANSLYFVLGLASNGELLDYIKKLGSFDLNCARFYGAEILIALEYLHSLNIIHRDLKPENILFSSSMHIKITDFGTAKVLKATEAASGGRVRANSFVGTAEYVSPELLTDKSACKSSDIWALGCIIYQLIAGRPPFAGGNEYQTFQRITKLDYKIPDGFPADAGDLITKILVLDPDRRFGSESQGGFAALKAHPFFKGIDWKDLPSQEPPELLPYLPAGAGEGELRSSYRSQPNLSAAVPRSAVDYCNQIVGDDSSSKRKSHAATRAMAESTRNELLQVQRAESKWHGFVDDDELVIKAGFVNKRKGFFAKKRGLILTDRVRFLYVDFDKSVVKGEIDWTEELRPEFKNTKNFFVHTPARTYYLEDTNGGSREWVDTINDTLHKAFKEGK